MDTEEARGAVAAALTALGIHATVTATSGQVVARVLARDILLPGNGPVDSLRPGVPAFVGAIPVRYRLEDGTTLGTHGPR